MSSKLSAINEQLDELLMKTLELVQDYVSITTECESHQKTGFLNLAKARYIQGFHTVSKDCLYSEEYEDERPALLTVTREKSRMDLEHNDFSKRPVTFQEPSLNVNSDSNLETRINKQFGFLSSSTLKYAKGDFRKCLEKTVERAKILEQISAVQERYKILMKEKAELENSAPAS